MEIKIIASGIGVSLPKLSIGASLFSGVYIQLRDTSSGNPYTLGISSPGELGGKNGTLIGSFISTKWMNVDTKKHKWLCSKTSLTGKLGAIELKGTMIYYGKVDISITIYDENNESKFSINKVNIEASGGQLATTKIRGTIVDMMGRTNQSGGLCGTK